MSIIEAALARAKRIHEEMVPAARREPVASESLAPKRRPVALESPPPPAHIEAERLIVDGDVCRENRVLVSVNRNSGPPGVYDAYRILRTRLRSRLATERWSSLAITSSSPSEGKSVTALNLSLTLALERRQNVFLLDLDLRNPSLCRYLGVTPRSGIGSCLMGETRPEDLFFTIGVDNLFIAGGDARYEHSSELLAGDRLDWLLAYIAKLDPGALVIADLPPLLSTADALVVVPKLSATLLVVAEGKTRRDMLTRAIEMLAGVVVAGIVLNRSGDSIENYYD
jgi:protein-tyrosine kinase